MKHLFKFSLCALALTMSANTGFAQSGETGLKDAYKDYFSIGVAVQQYYGRKRHEAATHRACLRTVQLGECR